MPYETNDEAEQRDDQGLSDERPAEQDSAAGDDAEPIPEEGAGETDAPVEADEDDSDEPTVTFESLGLGPQVLEAIAEMGFEKPTEVEAKAIPPAIEGRDLLVQSRTGTGKTAAFGIPMVQGLVDVSQDRTQALALCPTRELAIQVSKEIKRLASKSSLTSFPVYGGAAMSPQVDALRGGVHVVVGTPGRVLDHLRRRTFDPSGVRLLVLDECDEMLSMGFLEEISAILDHLPKERQTMLFSATVPVEIARLKERYLNDPVELKLSEDFVGVHEIDHYYYLVTGGNRQGDLMRVLEYESPGLALIFCNTRAETAQVAEFLRRQGFAAEGISSDLNQRDRERVMDRMRAKELRFLVATDIAARGIDLEDLTHVINFNFPESADVYIHRTGRTGRAGKSGRAVSLVAPREIGSFYYLRLIHKVYPEERHLPTPAELEARRESELCARLASRYQGKNPGTELRRIGRRLWAMPAGDALLGMMAAELLERPAPPAPAPRRERSSEGEPRRPRASSEREPRRERDGSRSRGRDRDRGDRDTRREPRRERDSHRRGGPNRDRDRSPDRSERPRRGQEITTANGEVEYFETLDPGSAAEDGTARLYVSVGSRHQVSAADIVSFFEAEAGVSGDQLRDLELKDRHAYVNVPSDIAEKLIEQTSGKQLMERTVRVERARPRR